MLFKNEAREKEWGKFVTINSDFYGSGCVKYAKRWAEMMEPEIEKGASVAEAAEKTQFEADTEGITGFMFGASLNALAHCWKYGEELRKWHNKEYDYEGDGVVNPAVIDIK